MIAHKKRTKRERPLIAEIVGPAGSGKTTLLAALHRTTDHVHPVYSLNGPSQWPILAGSALSLAPLFWDQLLRSRSTSWSQLRRMTRLQASHRILCRQDVNARPLTIIDQGPVYTLAKLSIAGNEAQLSRRYQRWRGQMCSIAAKTLDLLIYLDAPNDVLLERVVARKKRHALQRASDCEAQQFLARYRGLFESLVTELENIGATQVIRVESSHAAPEVLAEQVLSVCGLDHLESAAI